MKFYFKILSFIACLYLVSAFCGTYAQEVMDKQITVIKKKVQFDTWKQILSAKDDFSYGKFDVRNEMVDPWRIQRIQKITDDQCNTTRYILATTDDPKKASEIIRVSVTHCPLRDNAADKLLNYLLGIQRPDIKLIEDKTMTIGDIAVHVPEEPEPAILFVRGNIFIVVENAGEKVPADIRKLANTFDELLTKEQQ
ncbi:MAG: hypothetical protein PVG39_28995 [Desulfobacteraceae bacterium]|jgi:hypothetical protein